ncbi:MAG: porin, partial [Rhodospirillaceae bacterium]|nr:porin [Rhodospirillaceae bacterium]
GQNIGFANEMSDYTNAVDGSVQYAGDVGGISVTLMAGAASASASDGPGMCGEDDYQAVNGGIRLNAQGFSVGGILTDVDDEQRCGSGTAMHIGASYGQGPWAISVTAHDGDHAQSAADGEAELSVWAVGARYTLGGGVRLVASFQDAEISNEAGESNSGQALSAGIAVSF